MGAEHQPVREAIMEILRWRSGVPLVVLRPAVLSPVMVHAPHKEVPHSLNSVMGQVQKPSKCLETDFCCKVQQDGSLFFSEPRCIMLFLALANLVSRAKAALILVP